MNKMKKLSTIFTYTIAPLAIFVLWYVLSEFKFVSPIFLPKPSEVLTAFGASIIDGSLWSDIGFTLYRAFFGFIIAAIVGVPIGLLMGYSKRVYNSLEFVIEFFRAIPATALFPLFLLIFGIGDDAKIAISAWGAGLIIILNSMYGVHMSKELRLKAAKVMNVKGFDLFRWVIFPEALPQIFTGFRVALSLTLVIVVVTEMFIGTNHGLGHRIIDSQLVYRIDDMYMSIFVTGIIGFSLNKILMRIENKIVHWKGK
ncbi:MAG: ABC transporter permease [Janthinobacterium sp.]|jgi:NitT/TauT family transport system permease protein